MALLYDCTNETKRARGMSVAARAIAGGRLVVLPTDTVYGVGADAFSPEAVAKLLAAKGRGPDMPVPVLVGSADAWTGIAVTNEAAEALAAVFWPGGLSLLSREQPSLKWNLGDTGGTVVVRMPEHDVALELLRKTGPMAVSSANVSGQPPARSAQEARDQLGDAVAVYLEGGMTADDVPSTIVDVTGEIPQVVRAGAISIEQLREVVPEILGPDDEEDGDVPEPPAPADRSDEPQDDDDTGTASQDAPEAPAEDLGSSDTTPEPDEGPGTTPEHADSRADEGAPDSDADAPNDRADDDAPERKAAVNDRAGGGAS